jgi:KDO2-lipid IV(A) lauroyltransferase
VCSSDLARLAGAKVVSVVTEMTDHGYTVHIGAPWENYPGASIEADTLRMNHEIEAWVERFPSQYLWTHRRFKTRPPGAAPIY